MNKNNKNVQFLKYYFISILLFTIGLWDGTAQKIAEIEISINNEKASANFPVSVDMDDITSLPDSVLKLYYISGKVQKATKFQIENDKTRKLYWITTTEPGKKNYKYLLVKELNNTSVKNELIINDQDGSVVISDNNKDLLQYNYKTVYPPEGIDTAYKRSGFIHPLYTPHGQVLTRIQAPDHYHHYGIWNPWTHVLFDGDTVDFWNLKDRKGTVRFADLVSITEGPVYAEYKTLHKHIAFKKDGSEKVAMHELQTVRVYQTENPDYYITDITIQLNCIDHVPVKLLEYRYGGLGWRATEEWTKENSETLTSEGKTRADADGSTARWCIVQGQLGNDYGGIEMMSFPSNYNHPEPLRIWPATPTNRGDVYANFSPTKNKNWSLSPGKIYTLNYRFLVFNGRMDAGKAEECWQYFANPINIKIIK